MVDRKNPPFSACRDLEIKKKGKVIVLKVLMLGCPWIWQTCIFLIVDRILPFIFETQSSFDDLLKTEYLTYFKVHKQKHVITEKMSRWKGHDICIFYLTKLFVV